MNLPESYIERLNSGFKCEDIAVEETAKGRKSVTGASVAWVVRRYCGRRRIKAPGDALRVRASRGKHRYLRGGPKRHEEKWKSHIEMKEVHGQLCKVRVYDSEPAPEAAAKAYPRRLSFVTYNGGHIW